MGCWNKCFIYFKYYFSLFGSLNSLARSFCWIQLDISQTINYTKTSKQIDTSHLYPHMWCSSSILYIPPHFIVILQLQNRSDILSFPQHKHTEEMKEWSEMNHKHARVQLGHISYSFPRSLLCDTRYYGHVCEFKMCH